MLGEFNMHRCFVICGAASRRAMRCFACWPIVVLLAMHFAFAPARGEVIHFRMSGQIHIVLKVGVLPHDFYEGAPFQADLVYDTSLKDIRFPDDPQKSVYGAFSDELSTHGFALRVGSSEIFTDDFGIFVSNDIAREPTLFDHDTWARKGDTFGVTAQPTVNFETAPYLTIRFFWHDFLGSALSNDSLPDTLNPSLFQDTWISFAALAPGTRFNQFAINAIVSDVAVVPEPSSFVLAIAIIVVFVSRYRRQP